MKCLILALAILIGGCADGVSTETPDREGQEGEHQVRPTTRESVPDLWAQVKEAVDEPTPTPSPVELAEGNTAPTPAGEPGDVPVAGSGWPRLERTPSPTPEGLALPAPGTLVEGIQLTVYSCLGDTTGAYCPWGNSMACGGAVHRGAAACGYWAACGQRFRIVGDPLSMTYTCLDRGGAVTGIDVWFYDYGAETQAWRNALPQFVTIELLN